MFKTVLLGSTILMMSLSATAQDTNNQHSDWNDLLEAYVVESEDGVNRFKYEALKANTDDSAKLDRYIAGFETLDIDALSEDAQFAAWANLYNAVTIQYIIEQYPTKSIRSGYFFPPFGPWDDVKVMADGKSVSLTNIEHDILRPTYNDPRVHYAVNCASYGCPNLLPKAWVAETLDEDLDVAARNFVNHSRGVTIRKNGTLQISSIYKWFRDDFGGSNEGVVAHLLEHAEPELAAKIEAKPKTRKHAYDWSLNDAE